MGAFGTILPNFVFQGHTVFAGPLLGQKKKKNEYTRVLAPSVLGPITTVMLLQCSSCCKVGCFVHCNGLVFS